MNAMRSSTKPSTARPTVGNTSSSQNHANDPRRNNISYSNSNNTSNNYENSQHIDSVSGLGHRNIISVSNSYSKSNNNNTISAHSDDEITELINSTIQLASDLGNVAKENKKLISIVDNKELLTKLEEILEEIEEQNSKLILTIRTSKTVWNNLSHLLLSLQELNEYIAALNKKSLFLLSKNRIRKRILLFQQDLRARTTQLMTSISLELLSGNSNNDVVELVSTSELYNDAITYYYGLAGRPKNYVVAFGKFLVGANNDDTDAMVMAARCYINGYGTDPDYDKGIDILQKAINTNKCPEAKNDMALIIIKNLKEEYPEIVKDYIPYHEKLKANAMATPYSKPDTAEDNERFGTKANQFESADINDNGGRSIDHAADTGYFRPPISNTSPSRAPSKAKSQNEKQVATEIPDTVSERSAHSAGEAYRDAHNELQYAIRLLLEAASAGFIVAKTNLGTIYEEIGDMDHATKWYQLASDGGCAKGTHLLASYYLYHKTMQHNRNKAFPLFKSAALNGEVDAFNGVGLCYDSGIGIPANTELAVANYRKGADLGSAQAMYNLGYVLVKGSIELSDKVKSLKAKARVKQAHKNKSNVRISEEEEDLLFSIEHITALSKEKLKDGLHWLRAAAENGVSDAFYQIGRLYEQAIGVPQDMKAALENYESAASRGHGRAALFAGHIYYSQSVDGDSLDFTEAAKFYLQAAENGVAEAMNALAILLEDGRGTVDGTPNVFAAAAWFYESGMCGYGHQAFFNLAMLLSSGTVHAFLSIDGRLITLETAREVLYEKLSEESYGPKGLAAINLLENVYNNPNTFNTLNGSYYNESYNDSYDNDEERQGGESNRNRNGNFEDNEDKILTRLSNYSRNNYNIRSYTVNKRPANNTNYNSDRPSFQKGADRYSSVNSSLNSSLNDSSVLYNSETRANNSNMNDDGTPSGELIEKSYNYRPKVNESSNLDSFREHKSEGIVEKNFVHEITKGQNIETECGNSSIEWVSVPASMNKPQNFEVSKPGKPPLQRETSEGPVAFAGEAFDRSLTSDNSTNNSNIDREIDTAKNTVRNTNGLAPEDITDSRTRDSKTQVANHVQANGSVDDHSDGLTSATSSRSSGFSESKAYTNNAESLPHRQHFSMREQPNIPPLTTKEKMERSNSAHLEHQQSLLRGQELLLLSNDEDDPQLRNETPPFDAPLQTTTPNKTTMFGNFLRKSSDRKASTRTYSSASDTVDESSGVDTGSDTGNKKKSSMFGSIMKKKDKTPSGLNDRSNSDIGDSYEQNQVSSAVFHAPGSLQNSSGSKAPPLATHTKEESFSDSGLTIDNTTTPTIKNKKSAGVFGGFMRKSKDRGQPSDSSPEDVRKNNDYNNNQNIGRSSSIELRNSAHEQSELVISDTESPVKAKKRNMFGFLSSGNRKSKDATGRGIAEMDMSDSGDIVIDTE